jgi:translation initiation factor 1
MENDWKKRLGVVYSTDSEFRYDSEGREEADTLPPGEQQLYVMRDRKNRKGKTVTLIKGFVGKEEDIKALGRELKRSCGVGGSAGAGEILIQGDFVARVAELLKKKGYQVKRSGG